MPVQRLWSRKASDGVEISAALFYDPQEDECTLEITVKAAHAEDVEAIKLSDTLRDALDAKGAKPMEG